MAADIQQLIRKIMSDPKIASSSNFSEKVYRDEPILITAPQMERYTPPRIRAMRKIAKATMPEAKIFVEQGKFMEDFEDKYDYSVDFVQYFPTYQAMTDAQLRAYFSWRTKVRNGTIEKTSLSYAFVHIYELLNQIGVRSPEQGFHALKNFWTAYREIDPRINSYVAIWLRDYIVYYNLDKSFLEELPDGAFNQAAAVLLNYKSHGVDEVFSALNSLSSYDLAASRFFPRCPEEFKTVTCRIFSMISDYYNRNPKQSARQKFFGRVCASSYAMFKSAVFYQPYSPEKFVYDVGDCHRYVREHGNWTCERFFLYGNNNKRIGALLKTIDYFMRRNHGFKSALQPGKTNKILTGKIEKEIAGYDREKRENAPPKIDIDVAKLHGIRVAALATQSKLLVEEAAEASPPPPPPAGPLPEPAYGSGLDETECLLLRSLLYGQNRAAPVRSRGVPVSVIIDGINEKLFPLFNDTVIVEEDGGPELIEDYREELKGIVPQ